MKVYCVINGERREPTREEIAKILKRTRIAVGKELFNVEVSFAKETDDSKATA